MFNELSSTDKYVLISGKNRYSDVYDLELSKQVTINDETNIAKNIKLCDNVSFLHYHPYKKKYSNKF
jgi:hypothetical protein